MRRLHIARACAIAALAISTSSFAMSNQWGPSCNFFGFETATSGKNLLLEYTSESFEREVSFACQEQVLDFNVSVTAQTLYKGQMVEGRVVDFWQGLGVKRYANAIDNGSIDALASDTLVLEFDRPVTLEAVQFSYWDNTTGLNITDFAEVSVEGGGKIIISTTGTYNLKDTVANFPIGNMVGTRFYIKAVGKTGASLASSSSSFRLAGFKAKPLPVTEQ